MGASETDRLMAETSAQRLSRLLALVPWLEQHQGVPISEAAQHFGVSAPQLERDLWLTICCGLPGHGPDQLIDIQFWDDDGRINVIDPQTLDRPLRLTAAESTALLVGLHLLAQVPGPHDRSVIASVTAKIEQAAGPAGGSPAVVIEDLPPDIADGLQRAIAQQRALRLVYAGATRDEVTERTVDPSEMVEYQGRRYLLAWCRTANAQRTFRLDRMRSVTVLDERAAAEPLSGAAVAPEGIPVRMRIGPGSRWLLESLDFIDVRPIGNGDVEATLVVAEPSWITRLVLGQRGQVVVLDPPGLRDLVRDRAEQSLSGLTRGTSPGNPVSP